MEQDDDQAAPERGEQWLMLAFPGKNTGRVSLRAFAPAKNGKSWYRLLPTREAAIAAKRELLDDSIRYKCVKVLTKPKRRPAPPRGLNAAPIQGDWRMRRKRQ